MDSFHHLWFCLENGSRATGCHEIVTFAPNKCTLPFRALTLVQQLRDAQGSEMTGRLERNMQAREPAPRDERGGLRPPYPCRRYVYNENFVCSFFSGPHEWFSLGNHIRSESIPFLTAFRRIADAWGRVEGVLMYPISWQA